MQMYLQCPFDRGPRLRERLSLVSVVAGIHGGHGQDGQLRRAFMRLPIRIKKPA